MAEKSHAILVALISGVFLVLATVAGALIAKWTGSWPFGGSEDVAYAGRVTDRQTGQLIKGAAVYVDTKGETQKYYTGDSGTFMVKLSPTTKTVHIRVQIDGYKPFDDPVAPRSRNELEDIRLDRNAGRAINIPEGVTLEAAIELAARQEDFGVEYGTSCSPTLRHTKVKSGPYHGEDMGVIIDQFKNQLLSPPPKSNYEVQKVSERKVYQIACSK